ncbi:hypothetical protein BC937DRAFT_92722 [Endogone sp. FLAS-F59071]|nr:hypothetical protein BC937DRAFT_92722 [Endogone sp. FLAS-F59071]|eukprot:RUS15227.1 hypothetical protein BC937DRAFT_92722 [Endogone sp. FLAS-F59071]
MEIFSRGTAADVSTADQHKKPVPPTSLLRHAARRSMDTTDVLDVGSYLQEFLSSVDNLPAEMDYLLKELRSKDAELQGNPKACTYSLLFVDASTLIYIVHIFLVPLSPFFAFQELLSKIVNRQHKMFVRGSLSNADLLSGHTTATVTTATSEEQALREKIKRDLKRADQLADEKCALADRAKELLDRHLTRLDQDLESLYPQHNLIPAAGGVTVSPSTSSSPGTQSPLRRQATGGVALTAANVAAATSGPATPGSTGAGSNSAYQTPYNGRGRTPQATLKRPRTTTSNSPGRPPRLPPGTPTTLPAARSNIKLSDPNAPLDFLPSSLEDALAVAGAAHIGPLVSGVLGEEAPVGEHAEDEERIAQPNGSTSSVSASWSRLMAHGTATIASRV